MADKKTNTSASQNGEFKTAPLGFDKNEVMAYIVKHNKEKKALSEENEQLKKALAEKESSPDTGDMQAELEKKKAELDKQLLDGRKEILDERRKTAQTEKKLHVLEDNYKKLAEEYEEYRRSTASKLKKAKKQGGASIDEKQLEELSKQASDDANAIIADAKTKAAEIIAAAKAYFSDTVKKTYDYKQIVLNKADIFSGELEAGDDAIAASIDVFELLTSVAQQIDAAVNSAIDEASAKAKKFAEEQSKKSSPTSEYNNEELLAAKAELENIGGFDEDELSSYAPMDIEPYSFKLKVNVTAAPDDEPDDDDDDMSPSMTDTLLSGFSVNTADVISSDVSDSNAFSEEAVSDSAFTIPVSDDISDLLTAEPEPAPAPKAKAPAKAPAPDMDDDLAALMSEPAAAPAPAPAPKPKASESKKAPAKAPAVDDDLAALMSEPAPKADNDISDLFADATDDDDISSLLTGSPDSAASDDISDLLTDSGPSQDDDISDLLTSAPAPAPAPEPKPAPKPKAEPKPEAKEKPAPKAPAKAKKADDDFSDLLAGEPDNEPAPAFTERAVSRDGYGTVKEKLNESRAMGVAGKDDPNDPWKELEAEMNGMTIAPPPKKTAAKETKKEEDSGDLLMQENTINSTTAQYDPSWDLKLMEGLTDEDEDDEMSSDNVGFFDL